MHSYIFQLIYRPPELAFHQRFLSERILRFYLALHGGESFIFAPVSNEEKIDKFSQQNPGIFYSVFSVNRSNEKVFSSPPHKTTDQSSLFFLHSPKVDCQCRTKS
jgi:hypothetical protein